MGSQIRNVTEESKYEPKETLKYEEMEKKIAEEEYRLKIEDEVFNFLMRTMEKKEKGRQGKKEKDFSKVLEGIL